MAEDAKLNEEAQKKQSRLDIDLLFAKSDEEALSLLKQGANPNAKTYSDDRPLLKAETYKRAELLLKHGADVNHVQGNGENFISLFSRREAESKGRNHTPSIIKLAVEHNISKDILSSALSQVYTAEAFSELLNAGADINKLNWNYVVDRYNMYSGKYPIDVKGHEMDISNSTHASEMRKIMKMAISKGYDFEKGSAISEEYKPVIEELKRDVKRDEEYAKYQARREAEFAEREAEYTSKLTEDDYKFIRDAKSNNVYSMRNYLATHQELSEAVIGYLDMTSPNNKFMDYYKKVMKDEELGFRANEEDYIVRTIDSFAYQKPNAYANAEEILEQNQDKKVNSRFFNAAYRQAEKNDPKALAFLIHIYQNSNETEKESYFKHLLKIRTQGNNSERNNKAHAIKEALAQRGQQNCDPKLETLSKVSHSPFSDLNKLIKEQKQTQK